MTTGTTEKLATASKELKEIQVPQPTQINRNSYEYKLAVYYYWLYQNEKQDHQITKQELVAASDSLEEYASAYSGMDRQRLTSQKIADQNRISEIAACSEIDNIIKPPRFKNFFKITWQVVVLVIGGLLTWQFIANAEFRQTLLSNIIGLIVLGLVAIVVIYLWREKK